MKNTADSNLSSLIAELEEARTRNHTALYNGFLKVVGETVVTGDTSVMEDITRRFLLNGSLVEKLYALDMAANNNLSMLSENIITLAGDRNETVARRARQTAEKLGIEIL